MADLYAGDPHVAVVLGVPSVLGILVILRVYLWLVGFVWRYFLRPGVSPKRFGPWAAVTGATDGIGKAYCEVLAKNGASFLCERRACLTDRGADPRQSWPYCRYKRVLQGDPADEVASAEIQLAGRHRRV